MALKSTAVRNGTILKWDNEVCNVNNGDACVDYLNGICINTTIKILTVSLMIM